MARVVITGMPSQQSGSRTLGPVDRNSAVVEAEKGETVLTNMSKGLNNMVEHYKIGGEKHSSGGTPLNLPAGESEGDGNSFIFSASKKMLVRDKNILKYFGMPGAKPKTFAEISERFLPAINLSKETLMDDKLDKISKKSAELSMDKAVFYLNALKLLQESTKGFKDGVPNNLDPFFNKTQVKPEEIFAVTPEEEQTVQQNAVMAFGGMVRKQSQLPMFYGGGEWGKIPDTPEARDAKEQFDYIKNLPSRPDYDKFKEALWSQYTDVFKDDANFSKGIIKAGNKKALEFKDAQELFDAYAEMQERNLLFKAYGKEVSKSGQDPKKNVNVPAWAKEVGVALPTGSGSYDKIAKQQLAYRVFDKLVENKDKFPLESLRPFSAQQFGVGDEGKYGKPTISGVDGAYTNTSAGQISKYTKLKTELEKPKPLFVVENNDDVKDLTDIDGLGPVQQMTNPYGFRQEDLRGISRANAARWSVNAIQPWAATPNVSLAKSAYYSPERAIAAINEQTKQSKDMLGAFGSAQAATSNAMAIDAQAFGQVADTIGNYADKNVGIFNQTEQYNTQLANAREANNAATATNMHDKRSVLQQQLTNAVNAAKDKIVQMTNAATTNAANRYNLNTQNENFKIDPLTGTIYKANDREFKATTDSNQTFAEEFNIFAKAMPGISPDLAMKAFLATKSGKYVMDEDNITKPNELTRNNQ